MSAAANPDIVTDGLVFKYDTGDGKSYRGEPTTNVVNDPLPTTGWSVAAGTQGSALTRSYLTEDGKPFMRFTGVTNGDDYPRVTNSVFANSATITGTFSTSLEVRGTAGAVLRLRIYENGTTKITNSITLTSEWVRYTFDNQSTGFNLNQPYFNPATSDAIYDIRNIQIEAKPHSTPFVNGTRSATQALLDRTGNSTIDLSNVSFDSNAQITFDGTNDYIDLGSDISISPDNQGWTTEYWFNTNSASTLQHFNAAENDEFNANWLAILYSKLAVWNRNPGYWRYGSTEFSSNTWYQAVFICDSGGTNMRFYVNGEAEGGDHVGNSWTASYSSLDVRYIGRYEYSGNYSRYFNGEIALVRIYDRALTAKEVLQNYNATKSRFGL